MAGYFSSCHLIDQILEIYREADHRITKFQAETGLHCPPGCGECCELSTPRAMVVELLPLARELWSRGKAEYYLRKVGSIRQEERCLFYQPDPRVKGHGRCQVYPWRPLVCRLFGFGVMRDKEGKPMLITCLKQKSQNLSAVQMVEEAARDQKISVPSFDDFSSRMMALEPSWGKGRLSIHQALRLAIERYGLGAHLLRAQTEGDGQRPFFNET